MVLHKLGDFDPDYRDTFEGNDIKGLSVYAEASDEKIGTISDVLVDEEGRFRYFIVDLGFWIFGKKVLLPVGRSRIDHTADRVYAIGMTREQADALPEFNNDLAIDYDYEENVRGVYRGSGSNNIRTSDVANTTSLDAVTPLDASMPLDASAAAMGTAYTTGAAAAPASTSESRKIADTPVYNRDSYTYKDEPSLYDLNEQDHQTLRLYEERLVANKERRKTGEVAIGKRVETETARVAVPVEKERVVVERVTPTNAGRAVTPDATAFREGEVAHVNIYEETPDIHKETVVREEVRVSKVVDHDTVEAKETIRREELDVNAPGLDIDQR
ncbi:photosystem reaction center subunit H [Calothrix sp. HK-06]|nr:photosystem reaction center subunit H [Calothrix sp. HK-06]